MDKFYIFVFGLLVASLAFSFCNSNLPVLQNEVLAARYGSINLECDSAIAFDSLDNPHICYVDATNKSLKYAYYDGTYWLIERVENHITPIFPTIEIDSLNSPHICYANFNNKTLKYAQRKGSRWYIYTVADGSISRMSLGIDTMNKPHISFVESDTQKGFFRKYEETLKYAYLGSNGWCVETLDRENVSISATSIALDSTNNPHITYSLIDGECAFMYANNNGSSWQIDAVGAGDCISLPITILLDSNDIPHICRCSYLNSIDCFSLIGHHWQTESVNSCWVVIRSAMSYDSSGFLNISYFDRKSSNLHNARYDGNKWKIEAVDNIGWDVDDTSISLDLKGTQHLGYFDKKNKSFVYAHYNGEKWYVKEMNSLQQTSFFFRLKSTFPHV